MRERIVRVGISTSLVAAVALSALASFSAESESVGSLSLEYEVMRTEALQPLTELNQMYLERLESVKSEASENGETERVQYDLLTVEEGDDRVFSIMVSAR